jgi:hypothetical protein
MDLFGETLDTQTQLLVAVGSAVAAGCQPCLTRIVGMARDESVDANKLKAAAIIGQFVKDQPATDMKRLADELLDTHLLEKRATQECPMEVDAAAAETDVDASPGCGCK